MRYRRRFGLSNQSLQILFLVAWATCIVFGSTPGWSSDEMIQLTGTVIGPDEEPVSGLVVQTLAQRAVTDNSGAFSLPGLTPGDVMLELHGDTGVGRVRLALDAADTQVRLVYPVLTTVVLLHDNDLHFNFNYRDAFKAQVNAFREQYDNVYLLSAGDIFVRHPDRWESPDDTSYYAERCSFIIDAMNAAGYDACTLGNHELAYVEGYTLKALEAARFPLLGANVRLDTELLPPLEPYTVFETDNGLTIAVLGLSTGGSSERGVDVFNPYATARTHRSLAEEHELFVALTHIGLRRDRELAEALPELDVIIGGHSHDLLEDGEWVNGVLIGMAGGPPSRHQVVEGWPKYLGKIKIILENDRVMEKTARVMTFKEALTPAPTQ